MKIRNSFVSNSSSSSFTIDKFYLSQYQVDLIKNHTKEATKLAEEKGIDFGWLDDAWLIDETPNTITGDTSMDNFDMYTFLDTIGINMDIVRWG